jgi:hypothetical protein
MLRIADKKSTVILYDSVFEPNASPKFDSQANEHLFNSVTKRYSWDKEDSQRWFGADSQAQYEDRLAHGWGEGVDKLREIATKEIQPTSLRKKRVRGDQGDELDIHAVYRGDLSRAWTKSKRQNKLGGMRSIALVCNLSCNAGENASKLFYRGASVLKLAEALSEAGYSVSIYGGAGSCDIGRNNSGVSLAQFVEIKAEDHALDVSSLASLIAMPAYKRVQFHGGLVVESDLRGMECRDGLGSNSTATMVEGIKKLPISENAFVQPEVNTKESAEAWIDSVMAQIEPKQFEEI